MDQAWIRGRLVEKGSGAPLAGTIELVAGEGRRTLEVGAGGRFEVRLPPGTYAVRVEADEDHRLLQFTLEVGAGADESVVWRLDRFSWDDEILVYGEAREEVSRRVISAEELRRVPGSFGDPIRALQSLPGVARSNGVEGALVVRGAEPLNTQTYIDGVPVPYVYHFFVGRSIVNPSLIDDIEFYPGGLPSRFGDSTQAAVNVRTLDTDPEPGLHGRFAADLLDFSVSGDARLSERWTTQLAYRNAWIPQVISAGAFVYGTIRGLSGDEVSYPTIGYQDWLLRAAYSTPRDRVVLTWFGARDTTRWRDRSAPSAEELGLPYDPRRLMDTRFWRAHLRWDDHAGAHQHSSWIAVGPDRESSTIEGLGVLTDGIEFGELSAVNVDVRRDDRVAIGAHQVRLGANLRWRPVVVRDYDVPDPDAPLPTTEDGRVTVGAYGELQLRAGNTLVSPGIRANFHRFQAGSFLEPEPRLTARVGLSDVWTITAFGGRLTQIPPADRYAKGLGNEDITLMRAWQASAGVEGRWPGGLEVDVTAFGSRTENLVVQDVGLAIVRRTDTYGYGGDRARASEVLEFRPALGVAAGVELMVRMRPTQRWFGWAALTLARSLRRDDDAQRWVPADYDAPATFTLVGARKLRLDWSVSGRLQLTSGYPYTPQFGVYRAERYAPLYSGFPGEPNAERFPLYSRLDLRIDKTWTAQRARWTWFLDVQNVLNARNPIFATYAPNYEELVTQAFIPIIPNMGLEVSF